MVYTRRGDPEPRIRFYTGSDNCDSYRYRYSRQRTASPTSDPTTTFVRQKMKLTHSENQTDDDCHSKHNGSENWEYMGDKSWFGSCPRV